MNKFPIQTKVTVRFSDTDAMGHVNNSRYFSYMEEGRVAYFKALFPDKKVSDAFSLFPFILADIQCSFKSPAFCGEILVVSLGVTEMRNSSFVMEYTIHEEASQRLVATGKSVLVMYDYQTQKSCPIPDEFRKKIMSLQKGEK